MPLIRKPVGDTRAPTPPSADVLQALSSSNQEERWAAARAASDVPGAAAALATALRSEADSRVREAMFTSLARIGSAQSIEAILLLLRADNASLRTGALDTLRTMAGAIGEYLPRLLNDTDADVRVLSCEILRGLPTERATPMVCELLTRENEPNVCAAAIEVLAEAGSPDALPALAQCAARFRATPFLVFAIKVATDRILAQSGRHV